MTECTEETHGVNREVIERFPGDRPVEVALLVELLSELSKRGGHLGWLDMW